MSSFVIPGEKLKLDTPTLRKHIGKKAVYVLKARGWALIQGTINDVVKRQVDLGNMDYIPFDRIKEIYLL